MNKLFTVSVAALALGFGLVGCDLLGPVEDDDSVTISVDAIQAITSSGSLAISGKIDANAEISSVTYSVVDANGTAVASALIDVSKNVTPVGKEKLDLKNDLAVKLVISATACDGNYTLNINAIAGTAKSEKPVPFTISGVKNCSVVTPTLTPTTVTLGSWNNTQHGSSLDADAMTVYIKSDLASNAALQAEIDIWFSNTSDNHALLFSPAKAATQQHPPKDWTTKNATQFVEVTGSVTFESITTQAQIDALWNAANAKDNADIAAGDLVVVKTNKGTNRLVKIVSAETTNTGTAVLIGVK
jgi:hypothetical protein